MYTQQVCSRYTASLLVEELVKRVGGRRTDRVIVVGCKHIELLIELAHNGFDHVCCRTALAGPNAGEMSADLIIIPAVDQEPELEALLGWLRGGLRPGGVLIFTTAAPQLTTRSRHIQKVLRQQGFTTVRRHLEPGGIQLLCCRKIPMLQQQAA
ncbi:MAG: hypothetical protein JO081_06780 [Alphaproteobacteria bacterium]|nr:hypothetical protein [Alphaproteobacteria bacterium]